MSAGRTSASPTMLDVARRAAVSLKTVSRVVNKEPGVSAATRQRVLTAIAELGFRRHDGASQLRSGRTATLGLVVEDLADPFYSVLAAAVERVARQYGYVLLTASAEGSAEREDEVVETFRARRVAGLVVVPAGGDHRWACSARPDDPVLVFVDRPPTGVVADCVLTDNEGGVRTAVDHLAALGHRRIGFLGDDPAIWTAQRRRNGFLTAVRALGLPDDAVAMGPHEAADLVAVLDRWTGDDPPVTALITGNNRITVEMVRAHRRVPRAQPEHPLGIVGFDDFELADLLQPGITVVAQDPAGLGERAAHRLLARLEGAAGPARVDTLPVRLLVRESSVPPPGPSRSGGRVDERPPATYAAVAPGASGGPQPTGPGPSEERTGPGAGPHRPAGGGAR